MVNDLLLGGDEAAAIRAFNRFYTRLIGLLDEGHLQSPYSLTEVRVLYELAQQQHVEVTELRARLGIDAGYLSRILARFDADGLVRRERSSNDGRRQVISLTELGSDRFAGLDASATAAIESLLLPLEEDQRRALVHSMDTVRAVLSKGHEAMAIPPGAVTLRPPRSGDFGWVIERHGALYRHEYDWDESFEALVAHIVADFLDANDQTRQAAWIAELDSRRAGCVFCVAEARDVAKLRLLLVEPWARGRGIGQELVKACIDFARSSGYTKLVLWTNDVLVDARRLYDRFGFELVESEANRLFGHDVVSETLSLTL